MCGIVGLLVKNPQLRPQLGELMVPMLVGMTQRGPDSAGLAVFTEILPQESRKISLYSGLCDEAADFNWLKLAQDIKTHVGIKCEIEIANNHAILTFDGNPEPIKHWISENHPKLYVLSTGRAIDLYKDIGLPEKIAQRYEFEKLQGSHLIGHTRMATESAVTPERAHPFTAGEDFCLVHNGSLSNPNYIRRKLEPRGIKFETDNDTEAACRFLEWRLSEGDTLEQALEMAFKELDGFYTFLMGTQDSMALVRDSFACKPAIVAEHDDYVAIASEFRSLAHLPGINDAKVFEPSPEEMYVWKV
jgi:methylamine---glutamate N-methyltransferase subunit A